MLALLAFALITVLPAAPVQSTGPSPWRATISLPDDVGSMRALDAFVVAEQLADSLAVQHALARSDWPDHVREWSAARWMERNGQHEAALALYSHAAAKWSAAAAEPELVYALFDRQRLDLTLRMGDIEAAEAILLKPLRPHHDAVWRAMRARVELEQGLAVEASQRMAAAFEQATSLQRRDPAFLHAARTHLAVGDTLAAIESWQTVVAAIRRPERLRAAVVIWEQNPALQIALRTAEDPAPALRFLVRALRREEALQIVRWRIDNEIGPRQEQELFVAEQLYRLRQHDALRTWLEETDRNEFDAEQLAEAEGYRWGVARREGTSLEVARGFDAIAETWPDTPRAAEAWWESAWMYELSDAVPEAVDRYARHVEATKAGRFRSSAALRTVLLTWRDKQPDAARDLARRFEAALGQGMDQAAAWWLLGDADDEIRLREEHPASPFWRGLEPEIAAAQLPAIAALFELQEQALGEVSRRLSMSNPLQDLPEELVAIARVAELGLRQEATIRLQAYAGAHAADERVRLQAIAIALHNGLPEVQARQGWFLQRKLRGEGPALDQALRTLSLPTPFAATVSRITTALDLPPALIWALMRRESFFDADVVSLAGAYGLMQLLPKTAERMADAEGLVLGAESDLFQPSVNLRLGSSYLANLKAEAAGNWVRALASYNAGEWNGERWEARLRPEEDPALGILLISYTETRSYVYNVLRVAHLYEDAWRALF